MTMIRQHIVFKGWVQGVGFRYRARHAADLYGATGWVRNDPDGSVTMELQGTQEQIDNVIIVVYILTEPIADLSVQLISMHDCRDYRRIVPIYSK